MSSDGGPGSARGTDAPPAPRARVARAALGWALTLACAWLLLQRTPLTALRRAVATADPGALALALALALASEIVLASIKYQRIVAALGAPLPLREVVLLRLGSYPLSAVLPLKAGELLRVTYLRRRHGLPYARGALATLLDSAVDAVALAAFVLLGVARHRGWVVVLAVAAATGALLAARRRPPARALGAIAGWTLLLISVDLLVHALVLTAFHVEVPPGELLLRLPLIVLAAGLPLAPLGLGLREAAVALGLGPFGRPEALLGAAITASVVLKIAPLLCGIPLIPRLTRRLLAPSAAGALTGRRALASIT